MKKLLLLAMPCMLFSADEYPFKLASVTFDLNPESIGQVNKASRAAALVGCGVGAAGGAYVANTRFCKDLSPWAKLSIILGGSALSGAASYLTTKRYVTANTSEKQAEAQISRQVWLSNAVYDGHAHVCMGNDEREMLHELLSLDVSVPAHRVAVYGNTLALRNNALALTESGIEGVQYPIKTAVAYLKNTARHILETSALAQKINTNDWPQDGLTDKQKEEAEIVRANIIANKAKVDVATNKLNPEAIFYWTDRVIALPEFSVEDAEGALDSEYKNLQWYEQQIESDLARLAALHGRTYTQAKLSKCFIDFTMINLDTSYADTPRGREARKQDIEQTKKRLNRLMQRYQGGVAQYNGMVLACAKDAALIPDAVKEFVCGYGSVVSVYEEYPVRRDLLNYNTDLNHNDNDPCVVQ